MLLEKEIDCLEEFLELKNQYHVYDIGKFSNSENELFNDLTRDVQNNKDTKNSIFAFGPYHKALHEDKKKKEQLSDIL